MDIYSFLHYGHGSIPTRTAKSSVSSDLPKSNNIDAKSERSVVAYIERVNEVATRSI